MKFRRLNYPGKTLIVDTLDVRYAVFTAYFMKFWHEKFSTAADLAGLPEVSSAAAPYARSAPLPNGFFRQWWFLLRQRYSTVIFLNPDPKTDIATKWAARLAFIKNRAGFAPLRSLLPLNFSLPFNAENHHFVHQLRIFFEHLTGEKIAQWSKPEYSAQTAGVAAHAGYGLLALDAGDPALPYLLPQLIRFINLVTRDEKCTVTIRSSAGGGADRAAALARQVSGAMTERAIENTMPLINPPAELLSSIVQVSAWATGVDAAALNLAAHMEVPTLAVFGPLNERVWQPFATRARVITGEFACRPCTAFPGAVKCTAAAEWQCVSGVSAELLLATLNAMRRRKGMANK